jgi:hypothetical protein
MQNTDSVTRTEPTDSPAAQQRNRWGRFVDSVLPAPSPDRLVRVAQVGRASLPLVEGSLADVELSPVIQEIPGMNGDSRFTILVSAKDAEIANAVLRGI